VADIKSEYPDDLRRNPHWLIEQHQPDLWIWGHIHEAVPPFKIGRTRMVSNPRGYVGQGVNPSFLPDLVVEVGSD
jgi:hypothetical protein